jgi:hypothetical protein
MDNQLIAKQELMHALKDVYSAYAQDEWRNLMECDRHDRSNHIWESWDVIRRTLWFYHPAENIVALNPK